MLQNVAREEGCKLRCNRFVKKGRVGMGLFDFIGGVLNKTEDGLRTGYNYGERNLKYLTDEQLLKEIRKSHGGSFYELGKIKCYLDEARRRKLIK